MKKKALSIILALSLMLTSLMGLTATAQPDDAPQPAAAASGTVYVPYPVTDYPVVSNFGAANCIEQIANAEIAPGGVDGSNALKLTKAATPLYIRLGANAAAAGNPMASDVEHTVRIRVRKEGTVNSFSFWALFGGSYYGQVKYTGDQLSEDWAVYEITVTPPNTGAQFWQHLGFGWDAGEDGAIYVDDIEIVASGDATEQNLFNSYCPSGGDNRASFDLYSYTPVESVTDPSVTYAPYDETDYPVISNYGNNNLAYMENAEIAPGGVNGSYAMKLTGTAAQLAMRLGAGTKMMPFEPGKTYAVQFKIRKEGTVNSFKEGVTFANSKQAATFNLSDSDLSADWRLYSTHVKTTATYTTDFWETMLFSWDIPEGSALYIDDIEIYDVADPAKVNLFNSYTYTAWNGNLTFANVAPSGYTGSRGSFDVYSSREADNAPEEGVTYTPYDLSIYNSGADDFTNKNEPNEGVAISALGEGVKGSYALKLPGNEKLQSVGLKIEEYKPAAEQQYRVEPSRQYIIRFKARIDQSDYEYNNYTNFELGMKQRWGTWGDLQPAVKLSDGEGIDGFIDGTWREFTVAASTTPSYTGYQYVYLKYEVLLGNTLYIDDIEVYEVNGDGTNLFPQGSFDKAHRPHTTVTAPEDIESVYNPSLINDWTTDKTGFPAEVVAVEAAPQSEVVALDAAANANYVLALGFDDKPVNGRVYYEMTWIRPCRSYHIEFDMRLVGDISKATVAVSDGDYKGTDLINRGTAIDGGVNPVGHYYSEDWAHYSFDYTDTTVTNIDNPAWAGLTFNLIGSAGSGVLIDAVSVTDVTDFGEDGPNLFPDGSFEKEALPTVEWSDTYYGEDATDLGFMNDLPKQIGGLGLILWGDVDIYNSVVSADSDLDFLGMTIISDKNLSVIRYEAKRALAAGKEIWLETNRLVSDWSDTATWQKTLTEAATWVQSIAGDRFQGFYFDEPHLKFNSNEEFIAATKYLRETFKKRTFAVFKWDSFNTAAQTPANVTVTPESCAYLTDAGYWNYSAAGMSNRISLWTEAASQLDPNVRKWFVSMVGSYGDAEDEDANLEIFNAMLEGSREIPGFGGIMLYTMGGATGGYDALVSGEDGTAEYNNYRTLLRAIADDFANPFGAVDALYNDLMNEDGVIMLSDTVTPEALAAYAAYPWADRITVQQAGETATTGDALAVKSLTGGTTKDYSFARLNDVNGDGQIDVKDLIHLKKGAASAIELTAAEYAAAGTTRSAGVDADTLAALRYTLLVG